MTLNPKGFFRSKTEVNNIKLNVLLSLVPQEEKEEADMLRDSFRKRGWSDNGQDRLPPLVSNT